MWLIHKKTAEEGWHYCQKNQKEPCNLLVFVKEGGLWRIKFWFSSETMIKAKTFKEELEDRNAMNKIKFPFI